MSLELRDYQIRDSDEILRLRSRNCVYVAPTGSGKTVTVARFIRACVEAGERVLFVANRGELVEQAAARLESAGLAFEIGLIWPRSAPNAEACVQIGTVQSILSRLKAGKLRLDDIDRFVIDECHRADFWPLIERMQGIPRLGLSATPWRLDSVPLSDFFDELIHGPGVEELIERRLLARPVVLTIERAAMHELTRGLKVASSGDFTSAAIERRLTRSTIADDAPTKYLRYARGRKAAVFAASHAHAQVLHRGFELRGIRCELLMGDLPIAARLAVFDRLRRGTTRVVITCDLISEGFDMPDLDCVILARPTASVSRYLQWCGRAMRGRVAIILDLCGNGYLHGHPATGREWSLEREPKVEGEWGAGPNGELVRRDPAEVRAELELLQRELPCCAVDGCPLPATMRSVYNHRRHGHKTYCTKHPRGARGRGEVPCGVDGCRLSATPHSVSNARRRPGTKAYCKEHPRGGPEGMKEWVRKTHAGINPEQRLERLRKANAAMTPEQRSARTAKGHAARARRAS